MSEGITTIWNDKGTKILITLTLNYNKFIKSKNVSSFITAF